MVWLRVDDIEMIRNPSVKTLQEAIYRNSQYKDILTPFLTKDTEFLVEPTDDEIRILVKEQLGKRKTSKIILSFRSPLDTLFKNNHPFLYLLLRNKHFPMKSIEKEANVSDEMVLTQKLGFTMSEPKYGFESVAGNYRLKAYIEQLKYLDECGLGNPLSALMFFGTAGSGKTHVAQAIAHRFGYKFGYLDLPHFMTLPSPTQAIDELFDFLQDQDQRCVLLIDEIEKMFDFTGNDLKSKNVFGKLLTRLNDIYNDDKNNIVFIATANNIAQIVENSPEFMRKGRFDDIFFLSYPDEKSAIAVIELFINKVSSKTKESMIDILSSELTPKKMNVLKKLSNNEEGLIEKMAEKLAVTIDARKVYRAVENVYPDKLKVSDDEEFIYSPPEIHTVIKEIQNTALYTIVTKINESPERYTNIDELEGANEILIEDDWKLMEDVIRKINPLQMSASVGIKKQIAQAENYKGDAEHEHYKKG